MSLANEKKWGAVSGGTPTEDSATKTWPGLVAWQVQPALAAPSEAAFAEPVSLDMPDAGIAGQTLEMYEAERRQRQLFESALAHIPMATAIVDAETLRIRWANRAFADFVDEPYRSGEMVGETLEQVMPHVAASGVVEIMHTVASTGRACSDLRYIYKGPRYGARYWRFSLQPLASDGTSGDLALHIEDVTDRVSGPKYNSKPQGASTPVCVKR